MVRVCAFARVYTPPGPFRELQRSHGARGVSHLSLHTLPRSGDVAFLHTQSEDKPHLPSSPSNRQDRALLWNQYLATAFRFVWSPTSFSASVGRKWPNTPAPVLRWTHCCHIKAQICTVAQLKFPTLPLLCTPKPHTFLEQMAELNNLFVLSAMAWVPLPTDIDRGI